MTDAESNAETPREEELLNRLENIEREVRAARDDKIDCTPWDFQLPSGSDLKHMRMECGLSPSEAAEQIDYNQGTIKHVEAGQDAPGRRLIQSLLRLYKMEWPRHAR